MTSTKPDATDRNVTKKSPRKPRKQTSVSEYGVGFAEIFEENYIPRFLPLIDLPSRPDKTSEKSS